MIVMVVILDVDGTLVNNFERIEKCRDYGKINWDCAFNEENVLKFDKPMPKKYYEYLLDKIERDGKVF